jgi:hypothetical protein
MSDALSLPVAAGGCGGRCGDGGVGDGGGTGRGGLGVNPLNITCSESRPTAPWWLGATAAVPMAVLAASSLVARSNGMT